MVLYGFYGWAYLQIKLFCISVHHFLVAQGQFSEFSVSSLQMGAVNMRKQFLFTVM